MKFDLKYEKSQKIELNLQKEFEISDIKTITDEVLKGQDVIIQKVELYEDMVSIISNQMPQSIIAYYNIVHVPTCVMCSTFD